MKKSILMLYLIIALSNSLFGANRFARVSSKEIVIDRATNLVWQDNSWAETVERSWSNAITYCNNLTHGGYDDWKLPNVNELMSITDYTRAGDNYTNPIFNNVAIPSAGNKHYWTSTNDASSPSTKAWLVKDDGGNGTDMKSKAWHVRCVHLKD